MLASVAVLPRSEAIFVASTSNAGNSFTASVWLQDRMAVWARNGSSSPRTAAWDGASFAVPQNSANVGEFRIIQGVAAGSRNEAIVAGVASSGSVAGQLWNGSGWVALPALGSVSQTYWWSVAVGYESDSDDAVVVYADGANLNYRVWDGSTWTAESSIALPLGGSPRQLRLATHPTSDEMVLVVSNSSSQDYAFVWDGTSWGNTIVLASNGTGNDRTDVNVAYEATTGTALVVFGAGNDDVRYRTWSGSWSDGIDPARYRRGLRPLDDDGLGSDERPHRHGRPHQR